MPLFIRAVDSTMSKELSKPEPAKQVGSGSVNEVKHPLLGTLARLDVFAELRARSHARMKEELI